MSATKKDFISTAKIVATIRDPQDRYRIAMKFAEEFGNQNAQFRREQFMKACGALHPLQK